ncbi:N-acetylglucosamine-6-phosphate deacetylase [Notoacmeibacter ruber]|uniref:N-acetylglucosamine-6-phosphate deacetylase n=1 Tax=Notoacmeibacter ruber TaxID=2670375 RepID=A0A3L7J494_9HYPH|nr:N-acetylglucosamine-6-phosphate deacetylase [Notoacmeibacter ruber]RLQ85300.1 N-acetylglucosamine-6-phosphate deacetylase [Notoacmeibacter ruber]
MTIFRSGRLFDGTRLLERHDLIVDNAAVTAVRPRDATASGDIVDLGEDALIAPGLVDIQANGGAGLLLNEAPDLATIEAMCQSHLMAGTTALLPTLITSDPEATTRAVVSAVEAARTSIPGFAGLHLEGPHLDPLRKGAHDPGLIRPMQQEDLDLLLWAARELPSLLVTLAPESANVRQIAAIAKGGAVVALGHTNTGFDAANAAFRAGASMVTHLFNAMSQIGNREPGLVGAALRRDSVYAGLIADGIHVHPANIALAAGATSRIALVTDAMACFGTDDETFSLNGRDVIRKDGALRLADGTLAGADLDLPTAIRNYSAMSGLGLEAALAAATATPAQALGRFPELGSLSPGVPASFVCLDPDLVLSGVWYEGRPVTASAA